MNIRLQQAIRRCAQRNTIPERTYTAVIVNVEWDDTQRLAVRMLPTGGEETVLVNRLATDVYAVAAGSQAIGRLVLVQSIQGRLYAAALIQEAS